VALESGSSSAGNRRARKIHGRRSELILHFSGVDPHDPALLSKHQTRFTESDLGPFRPVYRKYLQALLDNGYERLAKIPYAFGVTKYGAPIVPEMRQVFRHRYDANGPHPAPDPFNLGPEAFALPTDQLPKASPRISLLLFEAWKRRDLLKDSFDVYSRDGREGLLAWYASVGERVVGVGKEFVEGDRRELAAYSRSKERQSADRTNSAWLPALWGLRRAVAVAGLRAFDSSRKSARMRRLYYRIPEHSRASLHRKLLRTIGTLSLWSRPEFAAPVAAEATTTAGINLIGYFRGEFSIGECARAFAKAALENGPRVSLVNFDGGVLDRCGDHRFDKYLTVRPSYPVNLCFVNADQTPLLFDTLRPALKGRYNVGFWFWELEKFPAAWKGALQRVDEVWVSSAFVRNAVSGAAGEKPVRWIPYPIEVSLSRPYTRQEFGLDAAPFTFLFNFDYYSFVERKNPAALIAAFKLAFPTDRGVSLVLKSSGEARAPDATAALRRLAGSDTRVVFLDASLDRESMWGLLSVADAYVSLHRSEGLGLGLAESMFLGKPVIGTAYSGNMDFMNNENSFLVDFRLVDVPEGAYPHSAGQKWAEPDIESAAHWMRKVRDDSELRTIRAARGQAFVRDNLNERKASEAMAKELARITELLEVKSI
jgi:glycosyltransferase involved in cell wall biosynthesis